MLDDKQAVFHSNGKRHVWNGKRHVWNGKVKYGNRIKIVLERKHCAAEPALLRT